MPTIALESHYWDSQPHRPACITVRDDAGRLYTHEWVHDPKVPEEVQHCNALQGWFQAHGSPEDRIMSYSARWRTGWRHVVVLPPEANPC